MESASLRSNGRGGRGPELPRRRAGKLARAMETGLSGFAVAITGASGGIGESLVDAFAAEGCALALQARARASELAALVARKGLEARALCQVADLRSETEVQRAFDA